MNAATEYRRAFALLPASGFGMACAIGPEPAVQTEETIPVLIERAGPALEGLHRAAALPDCDWAVPLAPEGLVVLYEIQRRARHLAVAAGHRARARFEAHRDDEALADALAIRALGRHVGSAGWYTSGLVGLAIEDAANDVAAPYLARQDRATLEEFRAALDALPRSMPLAEVLRHEGAFFLAACPAEIAALDPAQIADHVRALFGAGAPEAGSEDPARSIPEQLLAALPIDPTQIPAEVLETLFPIGRGDAILRQTGGDRGRLLDLIRGNGPRFDELADVYALPAEQIGPALAAYRATHATSNPLALWIADGAARMRLCWERHDARESRFRARLATALG